MKSLNFQKYKLSKEIGICVNQCVNRKKQKGATNKCNSLKINTLNWWAHLESNQAPTDYES
jgi:hypothetical protein